VTIRVLHIFTIPLSLSFLRGQGCYMRTRGYDLRVVSSPGAGLDAFGSRESVAVHGIPMSRRITPVDDGRSLYRLAKLMRDERPDIVHAHTPKGGLLGTTAAALARVPVRIYHLRGMPLVTSHGMQRSLLTAAERTSCGLATHVLSVSASLRAEAIRRRLVAPSKIHVLGAGTGNGVDCLGRFDPDSIDPVPVRELRERLGVGDAPLVGFVGRLVRDKGVEELGDAWARIRDRFPESHLVIAGDFEERDAVPLEIRTRLEADPRVHLLGFVEDTATMYAALSVLAFPSHREGFPNVPLEAASMRVPVVGAAAIGTVDAIVDGVTGTLVPIGDGEALARGLSRYLSDPTAATRHGGAGRERVLRDFRRERAWEHLADFYDTLVPAGRRPRKEGVSGMPSVEAS
jgi:glycosyltransferase involved in cell wall biosynthesis